MFKLTAIGDRTAIEAAGAALSGMDPSPCTAVDTKEDGRTAWRLDAYAQSAGDAAGAQGIVELVAPSLNARIEAIEARDWVAMSLEGLPPVETRRFVVAGAHILDAAPPGKIPILIEAGPAFGTGHHGTTLGCLLALERVVRSDRPAKVLDVGAGTGVLAIAALKAGAGRAVGSDIDPDSVSVAVANAKVNSASARFRAVHAFGANASLIRSKAPYGLIFANILARPLVRLANDLTALLAPGGRIILSGLLLRQEPLARAAYAGRGLILERRIRRDGWITLVFRKPARKRPQAIRAVRRAQRAMRRASRRGRGAGAESFAAASTGAVNSVTNAGRSSASENSVS